MKSVGFVTRVVREQGTGRELAAVYVPTTPNPTSGYLEIVPVELITPTDWTVDPAMSFIISGGAVSPDSIPFAAPGSVQARDDAGHELPCPPTLPSPAPRGICPCRGVDPSLRPGLQRSPPQPHPRRPHHHTVPLAGTPL